jgi:hypothetical protein
MESWIATHYHISYEVGRIAKGDRGKYPGVLIKKTSEEMGYNGLEELSLHLTNEFEELHKGTIWKDKLHFQYEASQFVWDRNKEAKDITEVGHKVNPYDLRLPPPLIID